MQIILEAPKSQWSQYFKRPTQNIEKIKAKVVEIFSEVEKGGDEVVKKYTALFDGISLADYKVSKEELATCSQFLSQDLKDAIALAKANIDKFHKAQKIPSQAVETTQGVVCWQERRAIEKVGLYIPGGTAPLFSTVLMLAIPAQIAGCREVVLCSPPSADGSLHPAILYAAQQTGVTQIFKVGGIQAIAAMTFGTEVIPKVYKIFGPGNQYVTVAKQWATQYGTAIDMPAGPSELMVFADETAIPKFVAADLLSQAEHGVDSQVILISTSSEFIEQTQSEVFQQLKNLERKDIAEKSMQNSRLIYVENNKTAIEMINFYAPEHLIVCSSEESYFIENIQNAGSVFIGNYTPESAGDYASGTNHTLPTNGYSHTYEGVNLGSFLKNITFQKITAQGLKNIGKAIETMAEAEGLQAHKRAVSIRINET